MTDDATVWTTVGAAIAAALSGAIGWFSGRRGRVAAENAELAHARREAVIADADTEVYRRMIERLAAAEDDIRKVRQEMAAMRRHVKHAELHISVLERVMRDAGMEPPEYQPFDENLA